MTPQPEPVRVLTLDAIDPDHWPNPRGPIDTASAKFLELQASIAAQGILEPIVVGPAILEGGRHPVVAGWRRYTSAKLAGLASVPVHEKPEITTAHAALRAACAENMAREDMTPLAEANAIARLMELGDTQAQAAAALGVSERTARERLRLLTLPAPVQKAIDDGTIPSTAGRQLQVIADVSPKAATALTKQITAGKLRAGVLLDAPLTRQALAGVKREAGLLVLEHNTQITQIPLKPTILKPLKARARKAAEHTYGADWLDVSPTALGRKLLQDAKDAGKVLTIPGEHGDTHYLGDPEWIERATVTAVEHVEKQAADRQRERERQRAKADKGAAQDPAEIARRQHDRDQAEIHTHAQPFAAAMNAELGQRLRELRSCTIQGAVARLLLHLAIETEYVASVAREGFPLVDPEHRYATCSDQDLHTLFDSDVDRADSPEAAAAILVSSYIAFAYSDRRAVGKGAYPSHYMRDHTAPLVRAAAEELGVLPDRAQRLDEARRTHTAEVDYHRGESDRRRVLHELVKASRKGLQRDPLYERAKQHDREATSTGAAVQVWHHDSLDRALEQLKVAGHVTVDETEGEGGVIVRHYRPTPDGRKALRAPLPPAPLFPVIDPQDTPAADPRSDVVIVHVASPQGGEPVEAELQPERHAGRPNVRKVIYTGSRTAAWVAVKRIVDLPADHDDQPAPAASASAGTRTKQALEHIAAQPGITIPELAEKMGVKQNNLYRLLPGLADEGQLHKRGRGWFLRDTKNTPAAAAA